MPDRQILLLGGAIAMDTFIVRDRLWSLSDCGCHVAVTDFPQERANSVFRKIDS